MAESGTKLGCLAVMVCLAFALVATPAFAQKGTITGTVTDAETGEPLPGANVVVSSPSVQTGAATRTDGAYMVQNVPPGTYTVTVSYIGYGQKVLTDVQVTAGQTTKLDVSLALTGIEINPIAVTASRRVEKALDAPASISVLEAREITAAVHPSSDQVLLNTAAVDAAQTGVDRREIVVRGFNNAFSGEAYVLTDYRQAAVASLGVNVHSIMPNQTTDLERVEIVRGPGAALYGAGVDEGVIHYITKDPFNYPGTTLLVSGGSRTAFATQFRHAGILGPRFGYKITANYARADDWELDPNDPLDREQLAQDLTGLQRDYDYYKFNGNVQLEYRLSDQVSLIANGGHSRLKGIVLTGIGTAQADGFGYTYGQLRLRAKHFFFQTYVNVNNMGDSFVYGTGTDLVDNSKLWNIQAQYDLELAQGRHRLIFGFDYDRTIPDTDGTIYGRNEDKDLISEPGGYVQGQFGLTPKLDLTGALRFDYNNLQEDLILSPRVALVLKPSATQSLRLTYNKAFTSPGNTENFLDIVAREPDAAFPIRIRGRGSAFGFHFGRNPAFAQIPGSRSDLIAYSLNPATLGQPQPVGLPLDAVYASLYQGLSQVPLDQLRALLPPPLNDPNVLPDAQLSGLVQLLSPQFTNVQGFSGGVLGLLNLATQDIKIIPDVTDIRPLDINTTHSIELGYKGVFENRVLITVDTYYTRKKNFVGPLLNETPFVLVPGLASDLQAALAEGIRNNTALAGALGAVGQTPESVAALIVAFAGDQLPSPSTPVAIVDPVENAPRPGEGPELLLAYRNFGQVDYWGVDAAIQIMASENLSLFYNASFISDDFFNNRELDEANTSLTLALNAPAFKSKFGFNYSKPFGLSFNVAGRAVQGFRVESGPYIGNVDNYFVLDIGGGYDLGRYAPGARVDFLIQNVLGEDHREFIGAPEIGRFGMVQFSYTFR